MNPYNVVRLTIPNKDPKCPGCDATSLVEVRVYSDYYEVIDIIDHELFCRYSTCRTEEELSAQLSRENAEYECDSVFDEWDRLREQLRKQQEQEKMIAERLAWLTSQLKDEI